MRKELVIGCGSRINKDLYLSGHEEFSNVTTLDYNPDHKADVVWDLTNHPLPFKKNTFDEIHCYEVLEHLANQGDYRFFFDEFTEYARILKDGGYFFATVPSIGSPWAWGDPSHKRVIAKESLGFLNQSFYDQVGKTSASDFRYLYKADFDIAYVKETEHKLKFILEVKK